MKKLLTSIIIGVMICFLVACTNLKNNTPTDGNQEVSVVNLDEKYSGYYASVEGDVISITNYQPNNMSEIPTYQELISYGNGAGLENDGIVYYINVIDVNNSTDDNYKSYYAELANETYEVLIEEDNYFSSDEEKKAVVNKLIEIVNYVKDNNNE